MDKKYELTNETVEVDGHTLHRIKALKNIGETINVGDLGGFIEKEDNLSHRGICWVADDAKVYGEAKVLDDSRVYDEAQVYGEAWVSDDAKVYGSAKINGNAEICGYGSVYENAEVSGDAEVFDFAEVYGEAEVYGNAEVYDYARVGGGVKVYGNAEVCEYEVVLTGEVSKGIIDGRKKENIELD
jgi:carbonic anhydrase/acetyltransferase-like protein (isoleucine patch superfamily)